MVFKTIVESSKFIDKWWINRIIIFTILIKFSVDK
jgi:hypothetical protein